MDRLIWELNMNDKSYSSWTFFIKDETGEIKTTLTGEKRKEISFNTSTSLQDPKRFGHSNSLIDNDADLESIKISTHSQDKNNNRLERSKLNKLISLI